MQKAPAFQFYSRDFLTEVAHLPPDRVGVHVRFLAWSWTEGPLPKDLADKARIGGTSAAKFKNIWQDISRFWKLTESGFVNEGLIEAKVRQEQYRQMKAENGRIGAAARWGNGSRSPTLRHGSSYRSAIDNRMALPGDPQRQPDRSAVFSLQENKESGSWPAQPSPAMESRCSAPPCGPSESRPSAPTSGDRLPVETVPHSDAAPHALAGKAIRDDVERARARISQEKPEGGSMQDRSTEDKDARNQ
jgi:uncharacterized protein YdaU (DUF1376 family)